MIRNPYYFLVPGSEHNLSLETTIDKIIYILLFPTSLSLEPILIFGISDMLISLCANILANHNGELFLQIGEFLPCNVSSSLSKFLAKQHEIYLWSTEIVSMVR